MGPAVVELPHEGCVKQLRASLLHGGPWSKILYSSPRLGGLRPGWASLVMLGGCGSLDASSNLAPGPRVRVALPVWTSRFENRGTFMNRDVRIRAECSSRERDCVRRNR